MVLVVPVGPVRLPRRGPRTPRSTATSIRYRAEINSLFWRRLIIIRQSHLLHGVTRHGRGEGRGRTLGDSNEISLVECFLRATSPDACRNFLVTARFFRFHRDCGKIEIWCWEWQGWNIPVFDLRSGLGLRSSGFAFFFFFLFYFWTPRIASNAVESKFDVRPTTAAEH